MRIVYLLMYNHGDGEAVEAAYTSKSEATAEARRRNLEHARYLVRDAEAAILRDAGALKRVYQGGIDHVRLYTWDYAYNPEHWDYRVLPMNVTQ